MSLEVVWHDLECGGYRADLGLWRDLAAAADGPVLDVGAGTGRVALELAGAGHEVVALDRDAALLEALAQRARQAGLAVDTVCGDARDFQLSRRFALCMAPMQTVQLLGGRAGRAAFLARARCHLADGGVMAMAVATELDCFERDSAAVPVPERCELDGVLYLSQAVGVREQGPRVTLNRVRERREPSGRVQTWEDCVSLDRLDVGELTRQGVRAGLRPLPLRRVPATEEHVASEVVMLGA